MIARPLKSHSSKLHSLSQSPSVASSHCLLSNRSCGVLGLSERDSREPIGVFSTDADGHCYFYGERLDAGHPSVYRPPQDMIDCGPWEYHKKYHLRGNVESPVQPR